MGVRTEYTVNEEKRILMNIILCTTNTTTDISWKLFQTVIDYYSNVYKAGKHLEEY